MKVVINTSYGGFSLNAFTVLKLIEAKKENLYVYSDYLRYGGKYSADYDYAKITLDNYEEVGNSFVCSTCDFGATVSAQKFEKSGCKDYRYRLPNVDEMRFDKDLIKIIEENGSAKCSSGCSNLIIVTIPKGSYFRINEYDGAESIEIFDKSNFPYYADF